MKQASTTFVAALLLAIFVLAALSGCQAGTIAPASDAAKPALATEPAPAATPTSVPTSAAPLVIREAVSDSDGKVVFRDSADRAWDFVIKNKDPKIKIPVSNIPVWFAGRYPDLLVLAKDGADAFVPLVQELNLEQIQPGSPFPLEMTPVIPLYKNAAEWYGYFWAMPDIEKWVSSTRESCLNTKNGWKAEGGQQILYMSKADPFTETLAGEKYMFTLSRPSSVFGAVQALRWKRYTIGDGAPELVRPVGFCVDPLETGDPMFPVQRMAYMLNAKDASMLYNVIPQSHISTTLYVTNNFSTRSKEDPLQYWKTIETAIEAPGAPPARCDGYGYAGEYLQVWTSGWSPEWVQENICQDGPCKPLIPPWKSSTVGFFFRYVEEPASSTPPGWYLQEVWLGDSDGWQADPYNLQLTPCDQQVAIPRETRVPRPQPTFTPEPACPGAAEPRVKVNQRARVCTQKDKLVVRSAPGMYSGVEGQLETGTSFLITGGPSCAENWNYWRIRTDDGLSGWVAEGGDNTDPYFICPE